MKIKEIVLITISFLLCTSIGIGQGRPAGSVTKPPAPSAKTVSPAEALFNEGLKCPAEDYDCQVSNYTKAINLGLSTKEVFRNRGNAYLQRKDLDKAIADFTKLIELDLNDVSGYKNRGRVYMENVSSPPAINAAIRDFTSAIDLEPKDVEAYKLRSSAYIKLRNYEKAKADLDKISAIEPNNVDVVIGQAQMFLDIKQFDNAIVAFDKLISIKPNASSYLGRGNVFLAQKKYEAAISDFGKAIELDSKNADAYDARGKAYLQSDKSELGILDINRSIEIDPKRIGSLVGVGKYFEKQQDYEGALKIYDAILASASKDDIPGYLYNRGWLSMLKQDPKSTMIDATKLLDMNSKNAKALELRCMAFSQLKDYQSAIDECTEAIDLDSTLEYAYATRGGAIVSITGKLEGAAQSDYDKSYANQIANASKILVQDPNDFDALVKRAMAYMASKNYAASAQDYKKIIELYPNHEDAYGYLGSANSLTNGITAATIPANRAFSHQILSQGISSNPDSVSLYFYRGANYDLNDARSAINDYLKVIENFKKKTKPTAVDKVFVQIAISQAANYYHYLKDNAAAISTINICDEMLPDSLACLKSKADFYNSQLKDFRKAVELYSRAIELYASKKSTETTFFDMPNTIYFLADAYFGLGDKTNAIASINRGLSEFPDNKHMWDYAAMFYKSRLKDNGKATEYYKKAAQLGSSTAQMSLGHIAEEKQRRKERRNAAILQIMGVATQTLEAVNRSRQTTPTSTIPQPSTPSRPQTPPTGGTSAVGTGSAVTGCNDGIQRGGTGFDCNQFVTSGHIVREESTRAGYWEETCKGRICTPWEQTPLSQVYFRGMLAVSKTATDKPYVWTIGFRNTSNSVVVFYPDLIYGDGTTQQGDGTSLTPGSEAVWNVTWGTSSGASEVSLRMRKYAICSNITRITDGGRIAYKCN